MISVRGVLHNWCSAAWTCHSNRCQHIGVSCGFQYNIVDLQQAVHLYNIHCLYGRDIYNKRLSLLYSHWMKDQEDMGVKTHPSCMDYSEELAKRARTSPWQCIDCKTCYICEDAGDPDAMLFCDACDKGYHMSCHDPPLEDKPTGKWVCSRCVQELGLDETDMMETEDVNANREIKQEVNGDGTSFLPTPSDSPVNFQEDRKDFGKMNGNVAAPIPLLASTLKSEYPDASEWTIEDVVGFFEELGFKEQAVVFREQEIDGKSLLLMKRSDVLTGLSLKLGPALKIYAHVQRLQTRGQCYY